jgi:short-subunit dehydrogenase
MSIFDRFQLTGKRLFITGGSRGLRREMAVATADAGGDVILVGRDPARLEKTAGDIRALGRQCWTIAADIGKPAECEQVCRSALDRHGPIDILINTVGGRRENIPRKRCRLTNGAN